MTLVARRVVIGCVAGGLALLVVRPFVYSVPSASMAPTLVAGDWLLVNHRGGSVARGDVIVFNLRGESYVKRVIGLAGDRIDEIDGRWRVNGVPLLSGPLGDASLDDDGAVRSSLAMAAYALEREHSSERTWRVARFRGGSTSHGTWLVPAGSVFVLGDNRDNSLDSRTPAFGFVPLSNVVGQVTHTLGSFRHSGRSWLVP